MGRWVKRVIGIKEYTCGGHQVLYVSDESLNCTPKTNITLYVNKLEFKLQYTSTPKLGSGSDKALQDWQGINMHCVQTYHMITLFYQENRRRWRNSSELGPSDSPDVTSELLFDCELP